VTRRRASTADGLPSGHPDADLSSACSACCATSRSGRRAIRRAPHREVIESAQHAKIFGATIAMAAVPQLD
jgi:hypothetical protein